MNFLSPLFLWMLPLIATPVLIYLFNRSRYRKIKFSSIKLLNEIDDKSIKKINIINILLIIIRVLIILSLILMISRPVYKNLFSNNFINNNQSIVVIGIDNSFSMQNKLDSKEMNNAISKIVDSFSKKESIMKIMLINDNSILYDGLISEFKMKNLNLQKSYSSNKIINFLDYLAIDDYSNYLNKYLFIITDMQKTENNKNYNDKYNEWNVSFVNVNLPAANLSIAKTFIKNEIILPGEKIDVNVEIRNTGSYNQEDRLLELFINEINVGKQIINLKINEMKNYSFTTIFPSSGEYACKVSIDDDDIADDNHFYFDIQILNDVKISIIDNQSNIFLNNAMSVLSNNNLYFDFKRYVNSSDYLLSNNNAQFIFINGFNLFNKELINRIESLNANSNIIIFPNSDEDSFNVFSKYINDSSLLDIATNDLNKDTYIEINLESIFNPVFYNIFKKNNIKISNYYSSDSESNTLISLKNNDFFLNKYSYKGNNFYIFSVPLDLKSSDLTIRAAFLPLLNKIINSTNNLLFDDTDKVFLANEFSLLDKIVSPQNKSFNYNKNYNQYTFSEIGKYRMIDINNDIEYLSINIPESEFSYKKNDINQLKSKFNNIHVVENIESINSIVNNENKGIELWRFFLVFSLILLLIEMYLSNIYIKNE